MKIEKVNDHQIRCTLTREDLANRELKISELAYGTEKAKRLFHDMMKQASYEFGFDAEDIPLMIEAIPLNSECIVLIITKVEDPEELDTRFSKFAPSVHENVDEDTMEDIEELPPLPESSSSNEISELFKKLEKIKTVAEEASSVPQTNVSRTFSFSSFSELLRVAGILGNETLGPNTLYQNASHGYLLQLSMGDCNPTTYAKLCNILSEYADTPHNGSGSHAYLAEHYSLLIENTALQQLCKL